MNEIAGTMLVAGLLMAPPIPAPSKPVIQNWCTTGYTVMVPDGREGWVAGSDGNICHVIADGEAYVTLIPVDLVGPVYPQRHLGQKIAH